MSSTASPSMMLAVALVLAACGKPPPRAAVQGQQERAAMDKSAADYAACIDKGAAALDLAPLRAGDVQAGTVATGLLKACADSRAALVGKVYAVRREGYPKEAEYTSHSVAEQSVAAVEGELRERAVTAIVSRQVDADKSK